LRSRLCSGVPRMPRVGALPICDAWEANAALARKCACVSVTVRAFACMLGVCAWATSLCACVCVCACVRAHACAPPGSDVHVNVPRAVRVCRLRVRVASRSVFPPTCYDAFDAVRLCMMQRLDHDTCTEVYTAFRPCADEMAARKARLQRKKDEDERRRRLEEAAQRRAAGGGSGGSVAH
jgi:hypothetical protein